MGAAGPPAWEGWGGGGGAEGLSGPWVAGPLDLICLITYIRRVIFMRAVSRILTFLPEGPCLHKEGHWPKRERTDVVPNARKPGKHEACNSHRAWGPKCVPKWG